MSHEPKPKHPLSGQQLAEIANKVRKISSSAAKCRYDMGHLFAAAKAGTTPKQFGAWFHAGEFSFSIRAAHDYVSYATIVDALAERLSFTTEQVMSKLVCDAAYDLGARALSKSAINELVTVIKAGGRIDMGIASRVLAAEQQAGGKSTGDNGQPIPAVSTLVELLTLSPENLSKRSARILPLIVDQMAAAAEAVRTGDIAALEHAYVKTVCRLLGGGQKARSVRTRIPNSTGPAKSMPADAASLSRGKQAGATTKPKPTIWPSHSRTQSKTKVEVAAPVSVDPVEQADFTRSDPALPIAKSAEPAKASMRDPERRDETVQHANTPPRLFGEYKAYDLKFANKSNPWTGGGPMNALLSSFYNFFEREKFVTYDRLDKWCKRHPQQPQVWFMYDAALETGVASMAPHVPEHVDAPASAG